MNGHWHYHDKHTPNNTFLRRIVAKLFVRDDSSEELTLKTTENASRRNCWMLVRLLTHMGQDTKEMKECTFSVKVNN